MQIHAVKFKVNIVTTTFMTSNDTEASLIAVLLIPIPTVWRASRQQRKCLLTLAGKIKPEPFSFVIALGTYDLGEA